MKYQVTISFVVESHSKSEATRLVEDIVEVGITGSAIEASYTENTEAIIDESDEEDR